MYRSPRRITTQPNQPAKNRSVGLPAQHFRVGWCAVSLSLALCCQTAGASEQGSPIPFVLPERVPFVVPEPTRAVAPESSQSAAPKAVELDPVAPKPKKTRSKKGTAPVAPEASAPGSPETKPSVANSAPSGESAQSGPAPTSSTPGETAATAPSESSSPASTTNSTTESASAASGKRFILQGKTEVIDFRLSEFEGYKQGMAALDKRHYAEAETLFKAAAAKLDDGYEKYRAECNFFEAKCLMMQGKFDQSRALLKSAIALFDQHDPSNPYKLAAQKQVGDLLSGKARMDLAKMHAHTNLHQARVVDQNVTFYSRLATDDSDPVLLRCDKEATSTTIHDCFAEMTCLETAELGTNVGNANGRWQPLLVKGEPAAFEFGAKAPVINVKVNGQTKEVPVNLPMVNGLRRILLATDSEKICALDVDNNDTWLLQMENLPDGTIGRVRWALLKHVKQKSATWGVSRGLLNKPRPTGNAWGSAPHNGFGKETGYSPKLYRNSQGRF